MEKKRPHQCFVLLALLADEGCLFFFQGFLDLERLSLLLELKGTPLRRAVHCQAFELFLEQIIPLVLANLHAQHA